MTDRLVYHGTYFGPRMTYEPGDHDLVVVDENTAYFFFVDRAFDGVGYVKTVNGGQTWSAVTYLEDSHIYYQFGIWYDGWTPNYTAQKKIHIVFNEISSAYSQSLKYISIDTDDGDSLDGPYAVELMDGTNNNQGIPTSGLGFDTSNGGTFLRVCRARGGTLFAFCFQPNGLYHRVGDRVSWSSGDEGVNWTGGAINILWDSDVDLRDLQCLAVAPGSNPIIVHVIRAVSGTLGNRRLCFDNVRATTYILSRNILVDDAIQPTIGFWLSVVSMNDDRTYVALLDRPSAQSQRIRCWWCTRTEHGALADIESVTGDPGDELRDVALWGDLNTGHLVAAFLYGTVGGTNDVSPYLCRSYDFGQTWTAREKVNAAAAARWERLSSACAGPEGVVTPHMMAWYHEVNEDVYTRDNNIIAGAYTVREDDSGQEEVGCPGGQMLLGGGDAVAGRFLRSRFPNPDYPPGQVVPGYQSIAYNSYTGTHQVGDEIEGLVGGSTAIIAGFDTDQKLIIIYDMVPGRRAGVCPFQEAETLNNNTRAGTFALRAPTVKPAAQPTGTAFTQSLT